MYKIYINENELLLADSQLVSNQAATEGQLIAPYSGKTKMLLSYIDMLEKTNRFESILIHSENPKRLVKDFEGLFKVIKAAGGVVNDGQNNLLFIFRRGFWDLPKGKMKKGEKKKTAAIREVEEETGISQITLEKKIMVTKHCYRLKSGIRVLKKSHWYRMHAPSQVLVPQIEEDITGAKWIPMDELDFAPDMIYKSINDVVDTYLKIA